MLVVSHPWIKEYPTLNCCVSYIPSSSNYFPCIFQNDTDTYEAEIDLDEVLDLDDIMDRRNFILVSIFSFS